MNEHKISIVTVTYNSYASLEKTILSVINQRYENFEYVIIDGGSDDGTIDIINKYSEHIDYWVSEPDKGIYDAMNKAISVSTGDWINFMNSGDSFFSDHILADVSKKFSNSIDIVYGNAVIEYESFNGFFKIQSLSNIWKHSPFCHQAAFIKASLMKDYKYDLSYEIGADHDFFFRAYKANKNFLYVDKTICLFDGKEGTTKKRIVQAITDKMKIALKYEPTYFRKVYYQVYLTYIHAIIFAKKLIGVKLTNRIIKLIHYICQGR